MFPENGSGVEAARDYGDWELDKSCDEEIWPCGAGMNKLTYTSVTSAHTRATVL